jgi:putative phosphoesterase
LPEKYAPLEVAEILNAIKDDLIVIEGNCDSQVDTMISQFDFIKDMVLETNGKMLFLTHGHVYNKDSRPKTKFDAVIYGHFHTGFIESVDGIVYANAGSLSLPKNNTPNSYIIIENGVITLKNIDGKVIATQKL